MTQLANVTAATAPAAAAAVAITAGQQCVPTVTLSALTAAVGVPAARIAIEDSPDGIAWTPLCVFRYAGAAGPGSEVMQSQEVYPEQAVQAHVRAHLLQVNDTVSYTAAL